VAYQFDPGAMLTRHHRGTLTLTELAKAPDFIG
jgi:hypothetical protein